MFNALFGIAKDVAKVVDAAVEIPLGITRAATKPVGEAAEDMKEAIFDEFELDED